MLLHIGDSARWVTVDPGVVLLAAALLGAASSLIWIPGLLSRRRSALRRLGMTVAGIATAVALVQAVLPYDHLAGAVGHDEAGEAHALHCHASPSSCTDAPMPSGEARILSGEASLDEPALVAVLLIFAVPLLAGLTVRPSVRPPLAAAMA